MLPTAMIVDDNTEMRATLRSVMQDYAMIVDECTDGSDVVQHYRNSRPDIVLMDIAMKTVDGIRATRMLLKEYPDARVVMVSNYDDEEIRTEAMRAGSIGYVHKEYLGEVKQYFR
ncbi:MAG: response regulator transcription factor [Bacteroidetes bacterium]|nr:response regulator transcription factor [Bacteroidota bacterium]